MIDAEGAELLVDPGADTPGDYSERPEESVIIDVALDQDETLDEVLLLGKIASGEIPRGA